MADESHHTKLDGPVWGVLSVRDPRSGQVVQDCPSPVVRRNSDASLTLTIRFSGRTYPQLAQIVRALCAVAGRCWLSQVAAVAVTVAVTRDASAPSRLPPPAVVVMRPVPMAITD
jgi:hypothetical protein